MDKNIKIYSQDKKAQILVITLLVLTIVSIATVTLVVLNTKDAKQVTTTEKYEQAYNASEQRLNYFFEKYGRAEININDLVNETSVSCTISTTTGQYDTGYECNYLAASSSETFGQIKFDTLLTITDKKEIIDLEITKDHGLDINLDGYSGLLNISWDAPAALTFVLLYEDTTNGKIGSVLDIYDEAGVFSSQSGDNPNLISPNHPFRFRGISASSNKQLSTEIKISDIIDPITGNVINAKALSLNITARMASKGSIKLTVIPGSMDSFPKQIREFTARSTDPLDTKTPIASIVTKVPLSSQTDSLFSYGILTSGDIK